MQVKLHEFLLIKWIKITMIDFKLIISRSSARSLIKDQVIIMIIAFKFIFFLFK